MTVAHRFSQEVMTLRTKTGFSKGTFWYTLMVTLMTLLLILHSKIASEAMVQGIGLCLQTVIPALFPLMVMARLLMNTELPKRLGKFIGPVMGPMFRLPEESAVCLILGIIGGYPVGAQTVVIAYDRGKLTRGQAEHMLAFCNNAGPAFVFGMVGALLGGLPVALTLYLIHILSAVLVGIVLKPHGSERSPQKRPRSTREDVKGSVLHPSIKSMAMICGYVTLFQVILAFLEKYLGPVLPQVLKIGAAGVLELSGGCLRLAALESSGWQYCMASGFLAFGGLCIWMQVRSVIAPSGLTGQYYFLGKLLQSAISVLLTWAVLVLAPGLLPRHMAVVYLPNHEGLLTTMLWVFAAFTLLVGIWCVILRNKAGKEKEYVV